MLGKNETVVCAGRVAELALAGVFLAGAVLKALDVNLFVVQISHYGVVTKQVLLSASALGTLWVETALGMALLLEWRLRGLTHVAVLALLAVFTGLIAYGWRFHDLADCGCFGPLEMSPPVSLSKNAALGLLCGVAWCGFRRRPRPQHKGTFRALASLGLACGVAAYAGRQLEAVVEPTDEKARPFAQFVFEADGATWDLGAGVYLVAMLSMTCEHCMASVEGLNALVQTPGMPPVVALCYDEEEGQLEEFRALTQPHFPLYSLRDRVRTFYSLVGQMPPRFILIRDGRQLAYWDETLPDPADLLAAGAS